MHKYKASFGLEATQKVQTGQTNISNNDPASKQNKLGETHENLSLPFMTVYFKGCSTHSQGFRKVYRIKRLRVNKAHYQFYTVSLFFPIQIVIVCERADTKEQLPGFMQVQFPSDHFNDAW